MALEKANRQTTAEFEKIRLFKIIIKLTLRLKAV